MFNKHCLFTLAGTVSVSTPLSTKNCLLMCDTVIKT